MQQTANMYSHKEFKKYIHSNIAQYDELTAMFKRNWVFGTKAEMTVSTTNGIITAQMSVQIGKAWEPRPGAPPRGAQDAWRGPNGPPGKQKPGAARRRRNRKRKEEFLKRKAAGKETGIPESARSAPEGTTVRNADMDFECHICGFIGKNDEALNNHLNSEHKMVMRANIPQEDGANPDLEGEQEAGDRLETLGCHSNPEPGEEGSKPSARDTGTKPKIIPANGKNQKVGLETELPKRVSSQNMPKFGDVDLFMMKENTRPTKPEVTLRPYDPNNDTYIIKLDEEGRHIGWGTERVSYRPYQLCEFLRRPPELVWHPRHGFGRFDGVDLKCGTWGYKYDDGTYTET